ncbi:MAG TPA: hypothetical protein VIN59_10055, partial [Alphaproteobacteria bacterium]
LKERGDQSFESLRNRMFAWCEGNAKGPWFMHEGWTNHGHSLDLRFWVELISDQQAFHKGFKDYLDYRPDHESTIQNLAIAKGVVPEVTADESVSIWLDENSGFMIADLFPEKKIFSVQFQSPELETLFLEAWGDRVTHDLKRGGYIVPWVECTNWAGTLEERGMHMWFSDHDAFKSDYNLKGPNRYGIQPRYDSAKALFEAKWGETYKATETDQGIFYTGEWPSMPKRDIPPVFMDYLNGKVDWQAVQGQMPAIATQKLSPA